MSRRLLLALAIGLCFAIAAAQASERGSSAAPAPCATNEPAPSTEKPGHRSADGPRTLLEADASAYAAELYPWKDEVVLVTPSGLARLGSGAAKWHSAALGFVTARSADAIVFYRDGWLRAVSLEDLTERALAPLARPPRFLLGSDTRLAWIEAAPHEPFTVMTLSAGTPECVLETDEEIAVATLHESAVYFVGRRRNGSWSIGRAPLDASPATRTPARAGRFPAMLAPGPDGIYFYDGPRRRVARLGLDLQREETVAERVICSPLSVSDRVACAHVGGVFDLPEKGADPRVLAVERTGPIARLATTASAAFWITDSGEDRLTVQSLALPAL